ncbi:MAG TPA: sigma-70 family RNA polymerase sigma factor, partial [Gaiellaceae bacterium]|nr:sigma-70 family RNA polymerase sigma factor [Gaiellaceae bacterium]
MAAVPSIGRATSVEPRRAAPEADVTRDLYERYGRQIFSYCVHQLGSREEAEDATQTTFMNAFRGLQRGVVPELESAWLFKIANNVILTRRRSSSRRRRVETPGDLDAIQDLLPSRERNADELIRLSEALAAMPDQQRRALLLREWQGLSYHEIADELSLSQSAVETLLFRARRTLAAGLTEAPGTRKRGRLRSGVDIGSLVAAVKTLLTGGAAVKTVATVAAVATTAVVAATPTPAPKRHHRRPEPAPPAATTTAPAVDASAAPAAAPVALAPAVAKPRAAKHVLRRHPPAGPVASHVRAGTPLAPEQAPVAAAPAPPASPVAAA